MTPGRRRKSCRLMPEHMSNPSRGHSKCAWPFLLLTFILGSLHAAAAESDGARLAVTEWDDGMPVEGERPTFESRILSQAGHPEPPFSSRKKDKSFNPEKQSTSRCRSQASRSRKVCITPVRSVSTTIDRPHVLQRPRCRWCSTAACYMRATRSTCRSPKQQRGQRMPVPTQHCGTTMLVKPPKQARLGFGNAR